MHRQQILGSGITLAQFLCFRSSQLVSCGIARALKALELACSGQT